MASVPDALAAVVGWLRCPLCRTGLHTAPAGLRCGAGHSFDVARQGYVNLTQRPAPANADTAEMVAARDRFLSRGHYAPLADAIAEAVAGAHRIVEVGAGTGHYVRHCVERDAESRGLATDVSPAAARRAARAHPRLAAVVADTWAGLPVRDGAVDTLLCIFAPRNEPEFRRVLAPGGRAVVVVPGPDHLQELREGHGLLGIGEDKVPRLMEAFAAWSHTHRALRFTLDLAASDVADLIGMGPNAFHRVRVPSGPATVTSDLRVLVLFPHSGPP